MATVWTTLPRLPACFRKIQRWMRSLPIAPGALRRSDNRLWMTSIPKAGLAPGLRNANRGEQGMRRWIDQMWRDDDGVLSFEWTIIAVLVVFGIVGGLAAARDVIID